MIGGTLWVLRLLFRVYTPPLLGTVTKEAAGLRKAGGGRLLEREDAWGRGRQAITQRGFVVDVTCEDPLWTEWSQLVTVMEFMARVCISKSELTKSSRDLHTEVASSEMTQYVWGNFPGLIGIIKGKHHFILNIPTLRRASTIAFRIAKEEKNL